jgi:hypothetical protein
MRSRRLWPILLVLVLLTGCSAVPGLSSPTPGRSAGSAVTPTGPSWVVVAQGSVTPSATARVATTPRPTLTGGFLPLGSPAPAPVQRRTCLGVLKIGVINTLSAVMGVGSASVSWYNPAGNNLVEYRLTAIAQNLVSGAQPPLRWVTIQPGKVCGWMKITYTGLTSGEPYMLSLDAVVSYPNHDGTKSSTIARSGVVYPN